MRFRLLRRSGSDLRLAGTVAIARPSPTCQTRALPRPSANKIPHSRLDTITNHASISRMLKSFAALFLLSAPAVFAQTNPTAYDALRTVGKQLNRDYVNRVVSVTGANGNPQPSTWRILIDDPNARGIREVEVSDGHVTSNRMSDRRLVGTAQGAM